MQSRRFLSWFFGIAGAMVLFAVSFNALAEHYILSHPARGGVQLVSGFERVVKPAWFASIKPDMVFIGSSRARLAFDPTLVDPIFHVRSFNYGVSSETAYEARRYIQDAVAQPSVKTIVVALDAFASGTAAQPIGAGFDELRLAVTPQGTPTPRRGLWLFTSRYLSGGALGMHALSVWLLGHLHAGETPADRPDIFTAYAPMTQSVFQKELTRRKERTMRLNPWRLAQVRASLDALCHSPAAVYWYFPADNFALIADYAANDTAHFLAYKKTVLAEVKRHNSQCSNKVRLFDFMTLNAVTADMAAARGQKSLYYGDPVHIRPQTGIMLLHAMLDTHKPGAPALGDELTGNPNAGALINSIIPQVQAWKTRNQKLFSTFAQSEPQ